MNTIEIKIMPYLENSFNVEFTCKVEDQEVSTDFFVIHTDDTKFKFKMTIEGNPTTQQRKILKSIFKYK